MGGWDLCVDKVIVLCGRGVTQCGWVSSLQGVKDSS